MLSSEGLYFRKMLTHGGGAALTGEMQVGVWSTEAWPDLDKTQVLVEDAGELQHQACTLKSQTSNPDKIISPG